MTLASQPDPWTTTVADAGGRYGVHPSWRGWEAPLDYTMFEPEPVEAARLAEKYAQRPDVTVVQKALGDVADSRLELFITAHRGYVGSTPPNPESLWFAEVRPDEGAVEGRVEVPCTTLDAHMAGARVDFMKIDVEGAELKVLHGAAATLGHTLGLRVEVQFDDSFGPQTASDIFHDLIDKRGFRLMRLDYTGKGQPLSYLVADGAYGALLGCDAVFVRKAEVVAAWGGEEAAAALIKLATFALRNDMPDYAVVCMSHLHDLGGTCSGEEPAVRRYLRKLFTLAAARLRGVSGGLYEQAAHDYQRVFGERMLTRHELFESAWLNPG
ncbi:MAG: FkbM family methyltransferase [Alphaproteobacteria bacterium]|nr:FkbM family methyltransferase [Alphaproteobacteria bacterium]